MYGAIFGDIIGSRFEFDRGGKTTKFKLFTKASQFTDDTVMTVAIGQALLQAGKEASVEEIRDACTAAMRTWGRSYPNAGYGGRFGRWLFAAHPQPYNSYGNGSAMRVSAAGWLYDTLERTLEVAKATAEVTHNHPEGIKGAQCTAAVIFLARTGSEKAAIRDYVIRQFGHNLSETLEQLRARHAHDESCQDTLPKALTAFFTGESYEEAVRNAVSLGGDTDTIGAIAGSMAEAMYGVPAVTFAEGMTYLSEDLTAVLKQFDAALGRGKDEPGADYADNRYIKMAVANFYEKHDEQALFTILDVLLKRIMDDGQAPAPMVDVNHTTARFDPATMCIGAEIQLDEDLRLRFDTMRDGDGKLWIPLFTDDEELDRGDTTNIRMNASIRTILDTGLHSENAEGVVINPFGDPLTLPKDILAVLLERADEEASKLN